MFKHSLSLEEEFAMKFSSVIHDPQRIELFKMAPSSGQHFNLSDTSVYDETQIHSIMSVMLMPPRAASCRLLVLLQHRITVIMINRSLPIEQK